MAEPVSTTGATPIAARALRCREGLFRISASWGAGRGQSANGTNEEPLTQAAPKQSCEISRVQQRKPKPPKSVPRTTADTPFPEGSFDHIVILKENHTFDSHFGTCPGVNGTGNLAHAPDPPTGTFRNNHAAWLARATGAVREQYQQADIQSYWSDAQQFALCDNFYTDVAGDSTPNHLMLIAATSAIINNPSSGSSPNHNIANRCPPACKPTSSHGGTMAVMPSITLINSRTIPGT